MKERIIIAGGTGFIGRLLIPVLAEAGYDPIVLTRSGAASVPCRTLVWDGLNFGPWIQELEGARALINLTGESMDCRFTPSVREKLTASRLDPIRALAEACRRCTVPPAVWIQAGSTGIYGDSGDAWRDEGSPAGDSFTAGLARSVEETFFASPLPGVRRILLRIGFVMSQAGGVLPEYIKVVRRFIGAAAGNGGHYVSWVHAADLLRIFQRGLSDDLMEGIYNASGPEPVTNRELMRLMRTMLHRPPLPAIPAPLVKIAAWFMRRDPSLMLSGRRTRPARLLADGFEFLFPQIGPALNDLLKPAGGNPAPVPQPAAAHE